MSPPRTGADRPCVVCGQIFYARPSEDRKSDGGRRRYCCMACRVIGYRGAGNPKWRGGRFKVGNGYVYAYAPDHPHATQAGYVLEHRLVVERVLGRLIDPAEIVHHRNHVRDDNRPDNLQVMPGVREHRIHHGYYQPEPCGACGATVMRSAAHRRRWNQAFCNRRCAALAGSRAAASRARAA